MKVDYVVNSEDGTVIMPLNKLRDLKSLADKRLVLLKRTEKKMVFCLECDGRLTNFGKAEELKGMGYEVGHTDDCELAEAIDAA